MWALATAGLALLVADLGHLGVAVVGGLLLGGLPTTFLAWKALVGGARKPAYGRPARRWNPLDLGAHQVIGGGSMPPYVKRPHDELLAAVLDPAVTASRLVVVRGGSSTGKTRAAYEAVAARLAGWQLDYPWNAAALKERLDAGIPARTVLWLGELRHYTEDKNGADQLGRLANLLPGTGHVLITTVRDEQWVTYTAKGAGPGAAEAGRLLEGLPELAGRDPARIDAGRGGVIDVPPQFTPADLEAADRADNEVLSAAAAAAADAGTPGQVTQYLAGVPALLKRYAGQGGDPYGQAMITAAMDATRLGHASPLPAALLQEAAIGYLTGQQRTNDIGNWRDSSLAWATEELNGAVRALQPVPPVSGTGIAGYRVADYLDQHGSRTRLEQLGPPSLWDALTSQAATVWDQARIGQAARDRGLYRRAAILWTKATPGSADAARRLIVLLTQVSQDDTARAAQWTANHVSLDNRRDVVRLLEVLHEAGADDAARTLEGRTISTLEDRTPRHARIGNLEDQAANTQRELREAGFDFNLLEIAYQLDALRNAGADDAAAALADAAVGHARIDDPWAVAVTLSMLHKGSGAARALADAAISRLNLHKPPVDVTYLLKQLRRAGADDAIAALLARDPARHVSLDNSPGGIADLLEELREAGADEAVTTLLARDPARHVSLYETDFARAAATDPDTIAHLLRVLRVAGADDAVTTLAGRAANTGRFELFRESCPREAARYQFGREPDGTPTSPWRWQAPDLLPAVRESDTARPAPVMSTGTRSPVHHRLDSPTLNQRAHSI